ELIAQHIGEVEVGKGGPKSIVLDEQSIEQLKLLGLDDVPVPPGGTPEPTTAAGVMDSIRKRLEARLQANPSNPKYVSLAARLEALRQTYIESAEESVEFLKKLLEIAREVVLDDREQDYEEGASWVDVGSAQA